MHLKKLGYIHVYILCIYIYKLGYIHVYICVYIFCVYTMLLIEHIIYRGHGTFTHSIHMLITA